MRLRNLLLAAAVLAAPCSLAFGASYSGIIAFGDSLSDPGNASIATAGLVPGPGYATRSVPGVPFPVGYFTNPQSGSGPAGLWVDQLASKLGVTDPLPALGPLGGTNFAIGSATTSSGAASMNNQVALFLSSTGSVAPSTALYTFWGGANDIFSSLSPTAAADTIANEILAVHAAGGMNFLWLNLPPLGQTPGFNGIPSASAAADAASALFDAEWALKVSSLDALGINVIGVDVNSLFNSLVASPGTFGFTNVTSACNTTPGCNPNTFLYWDTEHPTTYADSLVANLAVQDLTPTPEPPSVTLLALGSIFTVGLAATRRWQSAQPA
jgi:phospholipase/lecithinase/hemolysin